MLALDADGLRDGGFGPHAGHATVGFNLGGSNRDVAKAIAARSVANGVDEEFLVGEVAQTGSGSGPHQGEGIGVAKLNTGGALAPSFELAGRAWFGGCAGALCPLLGSPSDHAEVIALAGDRLAIAGWLGIDPTALGTAPLPYWVNRPAFAIVDAGSGAVTEHRVLPSQQLPHGFGQVRGIEPAGPDAFAMTGHSRDADDDTSSYITTRIHRDRIFGGGFQP